MRQVLNRQFGKEKTKAAQLVFINGNLTKRIVTKLGEAVCHLVVGQPEPQLMVATPGLFEQVA